MKRFIALLIVGCMLVLGACTTTPKPEPTPAPPVAPEKLHMRMGLKIWDLHLQYNIAQKKPDVERCYKAMQVTDLPDPDTNIWYRAGLRVDDYIVMIESRDGHMATLKCNNSNETIMSFFPGKARDQLCTNSMEVWAKTQECNPDPDGFWIERLRYKRDKDGKYQGFELETLRVKYE